MPLQVSSELYAAAQRFGAGIAFTSSLASFAAAKTRDKFFRRKFKISYAHDMQPSEDVSGAIVTEIYPNGRYGDIYHRNFQNPPPQEGEMLSRWDLATWNRRRSAPSRTRIERV